MAEAICLRVSGKLLDQLHRRATNFGENDALSNLQTLVHTVRRESLVRILMANTQHLTTSPFCYNTSIFKIGNEYSVPVNVFKLKAGSDNDMQTDEESLSEGKSDT